MNSLQSTIGQVLRQAGDSSAQAVEAERPTLVVLPEHLCDGQTEELAAGLENHVDSNTATLMRRTDADTVFGFVRKLQRNLMNSGAVTIIPSGEGPLVRSIALPLILARFFGRAVCLDLRAPRFYNRLDRPNRLDLLLLRQVNTLVVGSPDEARWLRRQGLQADVALPPVDIEAYSRRVIESIQPRLLTAVYTPELVNLTGLVKAFRLVKAKYPRAELSILLLDDVSGEVDRLCRREQVNGVTLLDAYLPGEMRAAMKSSDLFLNISYGGDHAGLVIRSLLSGLPVISADSVWTRSYLDRTDWYLPVDVNNPGELADAVIGLVEAPEQVAELSARSRSTAEHLYLAAVDKR